jgi:hypothetical protein
MSIPQPKGNNKAGFPSLELSPDCHFDPYLLHEGRAGTKRGLPGHCHLRGIQKRTQKILKDRIYTYPYKKTLVKKP